MGKGRAPASKYRQFHTCFTTCQATPLKFTFAILAEAAALHSFGLNRARPRLNPGPEPPIL